MEHNKAFYDSLEEAIPKILTEVPSSVLEPYDFIAIIYAQNTIYHGGLKPMARENLYIIGEKHNRLNSGEVFTHIGGHCHEFGHCLGLNHLAGGNQDSLEVDYFALMEVGGMNGPRKNGACPAGINPYYKILKNWVDDENLHPILDDTTGLVIRYDYFNPQYYIVKSRNYPENKFFILKNRLREGFDKYTPNNFDYTGCPEDPNGNQGGLLIWQIEYPSGIHLVLADDKISDHPENSLSEERSYSLDPFPIYQNQQCNDFTIPDLKFHHDQLSFISFKNIVWNDHTKEIILDIDLSNLQNPLQKSVEINFNLSLRENFEIASNVQLIVSNAGITIDSDSIQLNKNSSLQCNGSMHIEQGINFLMGKDTKIISYFEFHATGTKKKPIHFSSLYDNWDGIYIFNAGIAELKNCIIQKSQQRINQFQFRFNH
ncbi:MAG: hypothetical protein JXQ65_01870 [Candidatus Marinimicrobia bacterium]|nr:hypothetical protein [Candidatus Neomarinimicrobiota bacterium]